MNSEYTRSDTYLVGEYDKDMCQIYETVTIFSATVLKIEKGPRFILNKEVFFNFSEMNI